MAFSTTSRKFLRYLLSSNVGEVFTVFGGVMLAGFLGITQPGSQGVTVPLLATQLLWINLLTDAAPALAMGVDPSTDDVMARKPRKLTDRVIDGQMWGDIIFIGLIMAAVTLIWHGHAPRRRSVHGPFPWMPSDMTRR